MCAATLFIAIAVLGIFISGNRSDYVTYMLIGLCLGWLGDLLMHIPHGDREPYMGAVYTGAGGFLIGHIFYVCAFAVTTASLVKDYSFITVPEVIAFAVIYLVFALMLEPVFKFRFTGRFMKIALYIYSVFLVIMLVKSVGFGITYYIHGSENNLIAGAILVVGGILFFISDFTLGLRLLGGKKGDKFIKTLSLYTYFLAQLLLSTSILFVKA